jgi:hypothetical protein
MRPETVITLIRKEDEVATSHKVEADEIHLQ